MGNATYQLVQDRKSWLQSKKKRNNLGVNGVHGLLQVRMITSPTSIFQRVLLEH